MKKGYSIIEILVVVGVFAVLGVLATQSINLSLKSSKKSDSTILVKQELENAASNIERQLQTASSVIDCTTSVATASVGIRNSVGDRYDYACFDSPPDNFPASTSNDSRIVYSSGNTINYAYRLTSNNINITYCRFTCTPQGINTYIDFTVTASARGLSVAEGSTVTTTRKIMIRKASRK
jgi:prepilin-type N-terminal cleavage/methylation domain-containing protein